MKKLGLSLAALAASVFSSAASAQDTAKTDIANNTAFGDWLVSCEALTVRQNTCRLVQELSLTDSGALVARFVALPAKDGAILLAQVPIGVYLPGGAVYRFADREDLEQREMIWQRCLGDLCEAATALDADELALFAEEDTILFGYRADLNSEPIIVSVDISQFTEALDMIKVEQ